MKVLRSGPERPTHEIEQDFMSSLGALYQQFTTDHGTLVDYEALAVSAEFKRYCALSSELQQVKLVSMSFSEKITFFINTFNGNFPLATPLHAVVSDRVWI
jgi:hypothetical protein